MGGSAGLGPGKPPKLAYHAPPVSPLMKSPSVPARTFSLVMAHLGHESLHKARYKALRLSLASAFSARHLRRWYAFLDQPENRPFAAANKDLAIKPIRAYLSRRFDMKRRVQVLEDTYRLVGARGGALRDVLLGAPEAVLATVDLGAAANAPARVEFVLSRPGVYREGEFLLSMRFSGRPLVAKASFSLARPSADAPAGSLALYIGCFQGGRDGEDVRAMEKHMQGLRPKAAMLFALQEIGHALGLSGISGIGNDIQIKSGRFEERFIRKRANLQFDYDGFWLESEGEKQADGWFKLPARLARRTPEEMKPNKRAMYRRRYAMLDDVAAQIHAALTAPQAGGDPR